MVTFVLVDYDNLPQRLQAAGLVALANLADLAVCRALPDPEDVYIRLYGGWYDIQGLSRKGTIVSQEMAAYCPTLKLSADGTIRRLHCELASSLVALESYVFPATVRTRAGIRKVRVVQHPDGCANPALCSRNSVVSWTNGYCPDASCPVKARETFQYREQKLVDTLIACDLITLAQRSTATAVFLVSEDDDLVPPMLLAGQFSNRIWHLRTQRQRNRIYDVVLSRKALPGF